MFKKSLHHGKRFFFNNIHTCKNSNIIFYYTIASKKIKYVVKFYSILTYSFQNTDMALIY